MPVARADSTSAMEDTLIPPTAAPVGLPAPLSSGSARSPATSANSAMTRPASGNMNVMASAAIANQIARRPADSAGCWPAGACTGVDT
ncbi:hypothetical protein GCM10009734_80250 [Nonomuraea bangladeshensis]